MEAAWPTGQRVGLVIQWSGLELRLTLNWICFTVAPSSQNPQVALVNSQLVSPKIDDIKIKRKVSPCFLPLPVYLPSIAVLFVFFARLQGLEAA